MVDQGPIRVVIVDDHTLMREGTRNILQQVPDIEVVAEAADGEEAVQIAQLHCPDVILMDISLPTLNGIDATRRLKQRCPATAVLILTAYDDDPYIDAVIEAGAAGYLLKDVSSTELVGAVRAVHAGESVLSPAIARKVLERLSFAAHPTEDGTSDEILTTREMDVLHLAARGLTNKAIAKQLVLSPRTVQLHLVHIFDKLGVASRTEAVMSGLKRGWLRLEDIS